MQISSLFRSVAKGLLLAAALNFGAAMAQSEPTLNQVYATAQAGKLDEAQLMVQQVLISHPKSGKAHYVRAELFARQGHLDQARESLATAEKLSPGLNFAKPEAVQALRAQLAARPAPKPVPTSTGNGGSTYSAAPAYPVAPQSPASSSWALPLLLTGGVIVAGYFIFRRRPVESAPQPAAYAAPAGGLSGPQTFGMGGAGAMQPGYPAQGGYAQQPGTGLGGRIMGGVATGLAVGAGVMAAEAIGRNLMGNHNNASAGQFDNASHNDYQPIADTNRDMGGNDFGINDAGSWDDGGGGDVGGGDWDN